MFFCLKNIVIMNIVKLIYSVVYGVNECGRIFVNCVCFGF